MKLSTALSVSNDLALRSGFSNGDAQRGCDAGVTRHGQHQPANRYPNIHTLLSHYVLTVAILSEVQEAEKCLATYTDTQRHLNQVVLLHSGLTQIQAAAPMGALLERSTS